MDQIIEFVKGNLPLIVFCAATLLLLVVMLVVFLKRPKKVVDKAKFEENMNTVERNLFKKCNKCGGSVPKEDNLCQNCGQTPH